MKKYFMNENWDLEEYNDYSDIYLLVVEQAIPRCNYIYCHNTEPNTVYNSYNSLVNQYDEADPEDNVVIHIVKAPNTRQVFEKIPCADSAEKGTTDEAIEAINNILNRADCEILESLDLTERKKKRKNRKKRKPYSSITYTTGYPALNIGFFNDRFSAIEDDAALDSAGDLGGDSGSDGSGMGESLCEDKKDERAPKPKRYIKRYYIRPFNEFASNKQEILEILAANKDANCSVYSLKSLDDHDDVHLLKPSDIIYYYDEGILYDKNHVQVLDYDLNVTNEEERKKFANIDEVPDHVFAAEYEDRLVEGKQLKEEAESCVICGEEIDGYGNNPAPVVEEGRCCDSCNIKFVIPARLEAAGYSF